MAIGFSWMIPAPLRDCNPPPPALARPLHPFETAAGLPGKGAKTMLSFLCQLVEHYHREHALHPNLLYMSPWHYQKLLECLSEMKGQEEVCRFLMMQIVISPEVVHPYVAWLPSHVGINLARERERIL